MKTFDPVEKIGDVGVYIENCSSKEVLDEMLDKITKFESSQIRFGTRYTVHSFRSSHAAHFKSIREIMTEGISRYLDMTGRSIADYKPANDYYAVVEWNEERIGVHQQSVNNEGSLLIVPDISAYLFMSDDFEGGAFNFTDLDVSIKPKAGSMIIFESDTFTSVNAIKRGGRKIEVSMPMYRADKDIELV